MLRVDCAADKAGIQGKQQCYLSPDSHVQGDRTGRVFCPLLPIIRTAPYVWDQDDHRPQNQHQSGYHSVAATGRWAYCRPAQVSQQVDPIGDVERVSSPT